MPGRSYQSSNSYRYCFNGKEKDVDGMASGGSTYDYGFRIYNPALGKFLSVDPLTSSYPWLTPYQFASNRPIDGIDLDGLEYLDADDARVEFTCGELKLKVENFTILNRNAWNNAHNNPKNWMDGEIGISRTIANIITTKPTLQEPAFKDMQTLPSSAKGNTESGIKTEGYNRGGKREIARGDAIVDVKAGRGAKNMAKAGAVLDFLQFGYEQYAIWSYVWDKNKIDKHSVLAQQALNDVNKAVEQGMVPQKYQNAESLSNIMNVVLQGVNNTKDKAIYDIGMKIYNTISNPPNPDAQAPAKEVAPADKTNVAPVQTSMY